jgi:ribosomal protein S25
MIRYKFKSRQDYLEWCADKVQQIAVSAMVVDQESVRQVVDEIQSTIHCSEGVEMYE